MKIIKNSVNQCLKLAWLKTKSKQMKILKRCDQVNLSGDSIFQMQRPYHGRQAISVPTVNSVAIQKISEICEISVEKNNLFMQNKPNLVRRGGFQVYLWQALIQNLHFCRKPKTNPIQTQSNPIFTIQSFRDAWKTQFGVSSIPILQRVLALP
jgi:hypothetical protein